MLAAGVEVGTLFVDIKLLTAKSTSTEALHVLVAAPVIATVKAVGEALFIKVKSYCLPAPGAVSNTQ